VDEFNTLRGPYGATPFPSHHSTVLGFTISTLDRTAMHLVESRFVRRQVGRGHGRRLGWAWICRSNATTTQSKQTEYSTRTGLQGRRACPEPQRKPPGADASAPRGV